jgi:hypothetical protein
VSVIEVHSEQETPHGWSYGVRIERPGGRETAHEVTLAWVDHEHWSGGTMAPSRVVEALIRYLLEREDERRIPAKFDASTVRRWYPRVDEDLVI